MKTIWQKIGSRSGPRSDELPKQVPEKGTWDDDRGQIIAYHIDQDGNVTIGDVLWRRGRWEKQYDNVTKRDEINFCLYGPGYSDYECTCVKVEEF